MPAKLKAIFFCGDRSPYGIAHLEPIAQHFDLRAVVVADDARWRYFRERLSGNPVRCETPWRKLRRELRDRLRAPQRMRAERAHQARLRAAGAPLLTMHDVNEPAAIERVRALGADVVLCAAYPQIFKAPLLRLAPRRAINFHPSLLPLCRGAHPHYWCIATGEECGGVTAHFMTARIDEGDIVAQRAFPLGEMYYAELYAKLIAETPALVAEVRTFLDDPNAKATPQNHTQATIFRNPRDIHHRIAWTLMTASEIVNRVRTENAFMTFRGVKTVITRARAADENRNMTNAVIAEPGIIVDVDERGIWAATKDRRFVVIEALQGRRRVLPFREWAARHNMQIGERFD